MDDLAVETSALRKVYGVRHRVVALDGLDLRIPRGGVHAILGPELAGKSTALRLLTGLVRPTSGTATLLGRPLDEGAAAMARVGAVVDEQGFTSTMTVRRSLQLVAGLVGAAPEQVDEVIERVGLTDHARVKVGFLTDGEEQRLGIAAALLKEPLLLVLDEPTTGLEAVEAQLVTGLIRDLSRHMTVLISSQDLAEVQALCRTVTILQEGRTLASGRVKDLLGERLARTRVAVRNPRRALEQLRAHGYTAVREGDDLVVEGHEHPEEITRVLAEESLYVEELSVIRPDLQSFFRRLEQGDTDLVGAVKGGKRKKGRRDAVPDDPEMED